VSGLTDGPRRITHITEVTGAEGDVITLQDLFLFDYRAGMNGDGRYLGTLLPTGLRPQFLERLGRAGVTVPMEMFAPADAGQGKGRAAGKPGW
jgi:pilus assembly protein CpaF